MLCVGDWYRNLEVKPSFWPGETRNERRAHADEAADLVVSFQENTVSPFMRGWRAYLYSLAMELLGEARTQFAEERRRRAQLDFGDLLTLAAKLLTESPSARQRLQTKFRWLFVDEFQDTDPVQAEVVCLLASTTDFKGKDWTEARLRPGALFIVGDPKQSIYRFRRADIDIYNLVKERILSSGGEVMPLISSFRSIPALCDWSNQVFSRLFPEEPTPG